MGDGIKEYPPNTEEKQIKRMKEWLRVMNVYWGDSVVSIWSSGGKEWWEKWSYYFTLKPENFQEWKKSMHSHYSETEEDQREEEYRLS